MGRFIDLTGQQFGKLTVREFYGSGEHGRYWLCDCECGGSRITYTEYLIEGGATSCGCSGITTFRDLTGQKFNHLTVICKDEEKSSFTGRVHWTCECDCENRTRKSISTNDLRSGHIKSCGCIVTHNDLTGKKFGKLTVRNFLRSERIHGEKSSRTNTYWLCDCECGGSQIVLTKNLNAGYVKSCGCIPDGPKPSPKGGLRHLISRYKSTAKKRGIEFLLTEEDFEFLVNQNCFYCGTEPKQITFKDKTFPYVYNGIDRISSSGNYEIGNVVTCCETCNIMKLDMTTDEFFENINKILSNLRNKGLA